MGHRTWIYHATEEPKIIDSDDFESHEEDGWRDSPAFFLKPEDFSIKDGDKKSSQDAADAIEGVKDSLNGALNLKHMNRSKLDEYASEHFDMEPDPTKSHKKVLKEVRAKINGNG